MNHNYRLENGKIRLLPMSKSDSELYRIERNCNENRQYFFQTTIITDSMQSKWYLSYLQNEKDYMFSIYADGIFVGGCSLYNVDEHNKTAEFGRIVIGSCYKRRGYAFDAVIGTLNIARDKMHLEIIYLAVKRNNIPALKLYEKVGFIISEESAEELILCKDLRSH